ncbi:MAG: sporulation protein YqfD [Oscillospiraceae bacterium]|nr:sporulation protein YqfD [Oscillospiraceae bacterium]
MERISDALRGTVRIEISGSFPESLLNTAALSGIEVWNIECLDAWTVCLDCYENRLPELESAAMDCGCDLKVLSRRGGRGSLRFARRRLGLLIGLGLAALLLFASSLFIWRIDIRGSSRLSRGEILRALEDSGVSVGSFWPALSVEQVRSEMMQRLPDVGWMTVNVSGSRAVVLIQERISRPEIYRESGSVDLVAAKGGLIRRMNILAGAPKVSAGQVVIPGELLVSGQRASLTDSGESVRARGTVMAETWVELNAVCPLEEELKTPTGFSHSRFALIFGKRRVNLYFSSGKAIDACDKIISEYTLGMEGLFSLPIRVVRERIVPCRYTVGDGCDREAMARRLYTGLEQDTEGQILQYSLTEGSDGGLYVLTLRAHCNENIAAPVERTQQDAGKEYYDR